ncbi:MAG: 50S ribosomal protein L24 [Planctomycetes bacterium]|nr:50S ribosomal protein L24 [Planctomycetota bacterium]
MVLCKGDTVVVLTGDDKGRRGRVKRVLRWKGRVEVEQVNYVWKHLRKGQKKHPQGGRIQKEAPLDASNVQIVCPSCDAATRVVVRKVAGKNKRHCRKCGAVMERVE